MKKRILLFLCLMCCCVFLFSACANQETAPDEDVQDEVQTEDIQSGTHMVTDTTGAEVEVPNGVNRVVIISTLPLASVYCMVVEGGEKLVGLTPSSLSTAKNSMLIEVAPGLADASTDFAVGDTVNVEEVMTLQPDVVFYNANNQGDTEAAAQLATLGVACLGVNPTLQGGDTVETFNAWITLLGDVLGETERAEEIIAYGRDIQELVAERTATLTEGEKKSALIVANYTSNAIMAAGTTFGQYWLSAIGAINVATELTQPLNPVNLEQIYAWNPDVLFLNSFSAFSASDILNSTAVEGQDWSGLTAVQGGEVYKVPLGMYYWFAPCSDSPLALLWFAKTLYPELYADIDMDATVKDYYSRFYGLELTDAQLDVIYNPPAASAMQ